MNFRVIIVFIRLDRHLLEMWPSWEQKRFSQMANGIKIRGKNQAFVVKHGHAITELKSAKSISTWSHR